MPRSHSVPPRGGSAPVRAVAPGALAVCLAMVAVAALLLLPSSASACAGCRNPNLPQSRADAGPVVPGSVLASLSMATTSVRVSHDAGCADLTDCAAFPIQPQHSHVLSMVPVAMTAGLSVGVSERVALEARVPVRMVISRARYEDPDGAPYTPVDADIHHRDETLAGLGDVELAGRWTSSVGKWWLTARLGVRLPTGRIEEDPFALGDAGVQHQHIQFGSGTVDPVGGVDATWSNTRHEWSLFGQAEGSLYANREGFRGPARGMLGVYGGYKVSLSTVLGGGIEGAFEGPERWDGVVRQDASLGRTELLAGPQLTVRRGITTLSAALRFVVARHIVAGNEDPGELVSPVSGSLSVGWALR